MWFKAKGAHISQYEKEVKTISEENPPEDPPELSVEKSTVKYHKHKLKSCSSDI